MSETLEPQTTTPVALLALSRSDLPAAEKEARLREIAKENSVAGVMATDVLAKIESVKKWKRGLDKIRRLKQPKNPSQS